MKIKLLLGIIFMILGLSQNNILQGVNLYGPGGYIERVEAFKRQLELANTQKGNAALASLKKAEDDLKFIKDNASIDILKNTPLRAYLASEGLYPQNRIYEQNQNTVVTEFNNEIQVQEGIIESVKSDIQSQPQPTPQPKPLPIPPAPQPVPGPVPPPPPPAPIPGPMPVPVNVKEKAAKTLQTLMESINKITAGDILTIKTMLTQGKKSVVAIEGMGKVNLVSYIDQLPSKINEIKGAFADMNSKLPGMTDKEIPSKIRALESATNAIVSLVEWLVNVDNLIKSSGSDIYYRITTDINTFNSSITNYKTGKVPQPSPIPAPSPELITIEVPGIFEILRLGKSVDQLEQNVLNIQSIGKTKKDNIAEQIDGKTVNVYEKELVNVSSRYQFTNKAEDLNQGNKISAIIDVLFALHNISNLKGIQLGNRTKKIDGYEKMLLEFADVLAKPQADVNTINQIFNKLNEVIPYVNALLAANNITALSNANAYPKAQGFDPINDLAKFKIRLDSLLAKLDTNPNDKNAIETINSIVACISILSDIASLAPQKKSAAVGLIQSYKTKACKDKTA